MNDFNQVILNSTNLLEHVHELNKRDEIKWTRFDPPPEAVNAKAWSGTHPDAVLTVVRYEQNGQLTSRGTVASRIGLVVMVYPPIADELSANAEKACP